MREIRILQEHVRISDPHITSDNAERLSILGNVFDPLMRVREDGSFEPCLALSWEVSDDARSWLFRIQTDVRFHDGAALTAQDVVFSLRRMRDADLPGELGTSGVIKSYLADSEIEVEGSNRVRITLPEPMADLADLLCEIPILSEASVAALGDRFIGTGRFEVKESGERVILESSDARLIWEAEADATTRLESVLNGKAHIAAKLTPRHAGTPGIRIDRKATSVCATFMFNLADGLSANVHLRRAVNLAVDVEALIRDIMHGAADPLTGPLTRRHLGFDPAMAPWSYDPERAQKELALGDIAPGTSVVIDIPSVLPDEAPELAARVAEYLKAIGLEVTIRVDDDRPGYAMRVRDGLVGDLACFDSSPASTFRVFREKFNSGLAGPWWMGYTNTDFDRLTREAQSQGDLDARRKTYQQAYAMLREDAPWLFLYNPLRLTAISQELVDWNPSTGGLLLF